jgi:hypothetical protein
MIFTAPHPRRRRSSQLHGEAAKRSDIQAIPNIFWKLKIHYRFQTTSYETSYYAIFSESVSILLVFGQCNEVNFFMTHF